MVPHTLLSFVRVLTDHSKIHCMLAIMTLLDTVLQGTVAPLSTNSDP